MTQPRSPQVRPVVFRPRFTLMILYVAGFFVLFCFLFALPDLLQAARELPPGPAELSPEERARAEQIARESLQGRIPIALAAALVVTGVGAYTRRLPGLRQP